MFFFFTDVLAFVGNILNKQIKLWNRVDWQGFFQKFHFFFELFLLRCFFELFSHFIVKDEISLFNQDIQQLRKFLFRYAQSLLFLLFFITENVFLLFFDLFFILGLVGSRPVDTQLLTMNDDIAFDNFFFVLLDLLLIHGLNLVIPFQICFFKMFKFPLQFFELSRNSFILRSEVFILLLERLITPVVLLSQIAEFGVENAFFFLQIFVIGMVLFSFFLEHFKVVVKLFCVKLVKGFHFFVAFF